MLAFHQFEQLLSGYKQSQVNESLSDTVVLRSRPDNFPECASCPVARLILAKALERIEERGLAGARLDAFCIFKSHEVLPSLRNLSVSAEVSEGIIPVIASETITAIKCPGSIAAATRHSSLY